MISIKSLKKFYHNGSEAIPILCGLDIEIPNNESVSIVGTSGSGKTTLLNLLGGLDSDYEGSLKIEGKELRDLQDTQLAAFRNETIGYIFQSFNLLEHLNCIENVMLPGAFVRQKLPFDMIKRAQEVLELVGLSHKATENPNALSGGQRQRVAVARALFLRPRILLCDEPTGNLDRTTGEQILGLFTALHQKEKITLILVSHEAHVAEAAERSIRLEAGLVAEDKRNPYRTSGKPL
jgi:putative ABC transport system ATP-binding protein